MVKNPTVNIKVRQYFCLTIVLGLAVTNCYPNIKQLKNSQSVFEGLFIWSYHTQGFVLKENYHFMDGRNISSYFLYPLDVKKDKVLKKKIFDHPWNEKKAAVHLKFIGHLEKNDLQINMLNSSHKIVIDEMLFLRVISQKQLLKKIQKQKED